MRSLSILSGLALLATLANCLPYHQMNGRNLESTDLEAVADLSGPDAEEISVQAETVSRTQNNPQSQRPQTQAPATHRPTNSS